LYHDTYLSAYGINNIAKEKYDLNNMYKWDVHCTVRTY
jgi:hypothetical protein